MPISKFISIIFVFLAVYATLFFDVCSNTGNIERSKLRYENYDNSYKAMSSHVTNPILSRRTTKHFTKPVKILCRAPAVLVFRNVSFCSLTNVSFCFFFCFQKRKLLDVIFFYFFLVAFKYLAKEFLYLNRLTIYFVDKYLRHLLVNIFVNMHQLIEKLKPVTYYEFMILL